jgi:hypothetical protein
MRVRSVSLTRQQGWGGMPAVEDPIVLDGREVEAGRGERGRGEAAVARSHELAIQAAVLAARAD